MKYGPKLGEMISRSLLGMAIFLNSGCASIMNGSRQEVGIGTSPAGADCKVGEITVKSPSVVNIKRSRGHTVFCELTGYHPASAALGSGISGWVWGDLLFGGLIGLAIDLGTGGAYKLKPDNVQLTLQPKATAKQ